MILPQFERNGGFVSVEEQNRMLGEATVVIGGAGGDGGALALQLARMGVGSMGGEIRLADPDPFELQNINRQATCTVDTVDVNKAESVGSYIRKINPDTNVSIYTEGITPENVEEFVGGADLLIDETEFTIPHIGTALAREARKNKIPNLQVINVGFGMQVTSYDAEGKYTFEKRLGLSETDSLEKIKTEADVDVTKWLARLPKYVDKATFEKVAKGEISAPSMAPGVAIAAGVAATEAFLHLTAGQNHRAEPIYAPHVFAVDAMDHSGRVIKHPRLTLAATYARLLVRDKLGMNPRTAHS